MSNQNLVAKAQVSVNADNDKVWKALTTPKLIKEYMFGATVASDWQIGSPITWKGEMKGKAYEDKGTILENVAGSKLSYSHFSPLSGQPDKPDNYQIVTIDLIKDSGHTTVFLTQDKNATEDSQKESAKNWATMLDGLKKVVEKNA